MLYLVVDQAGELAKEHEAARAVLPVRHRAERCAFEDLVDYAGDLSAALQRATLQRL